MHELTFKTQREFNNEYPSGLFQCSNCTNLTTDRYFCISCGWRADGLLKTQGKGLKYTIADTKKTEEIFLPIEFYWKENQKDK